ncbi:MAG TPA: DUF934 domain-containing protein [Steroidobacteraceae bacterium]|jgi:uncharacterized protein (DUF934 family)|nr:DUF934 domain-containing protein [Steroidobacteraceae bacterium]
MRYILRRREVVADDWAHLGEEVAAGAALIVPLGALRADAARWSAWHGRLGARLAPADAPGDLAAELPRLDLVALEFPNPGDGRGYSQARLLRGRLGFRGELRAVGAGVKQDQVFLLARCGFDAMELAPGEDLEAARRALSRYTVAYQPGAAGVSLERQRFFAR